MLNNATGFDRIYIACGYTDLRQGIDGLTAVIRRELGIDPFQKNVLFLFCGRKPDKIKCLIWEGDGFLLLYKRLLDGRYQWPRTKQEVMEMTQEQFEWLMSGQTTWRSYLCFLLMIANFPVFRYTIRKTERRSHMGEFAVIDTETNWADQVMSIGTVIADTDTFAPVEMKYHILPAACQIGGMYDHALFLDTPVKPILCTRAEAMCDLRAWFRQHGVRSIFAYNACFDRNHLPELRSFDWYDIMRLAAYRQHNSKIPADADCCSTGRLKRGYGVESMLCLLSGDRTYRETHNAMFDAVDELEIMRLLKHSLYMYIALP